MREMIEEDKNLEEWLRRFRPAGPSPGLRQRIMREASAGREAWLWWQLSAAAALLAIATALQSATGRIDRQLTSGVPRLFEAATTASALETWPPGAELSYATATEDPLEWLEREWAQ
jgi:hypothetical protein